MAFKCMVGSDGNSFLKVSIGDWTLMYHTIPLHTGRRVSLTGELVYYYYNGSTTLDLAHNLLLEKAGIVEKFYLSIDFLFDKWRKRPALRVHSSTGVHLLA